MQKIFQLDWFRIGRVNPFLYFGGVSLGFEITKTSITYELDILHAYITTQNLQNNAVIYLKHTKSLLLLLADTFLE